MKFLSRSSLFRKNNPASHLVVKTVISGFDSAWTDNPRQPGAISHIVMEGEDRRLILPTLATFREALESLKSIADGADKHLVALDQPTIVNNMTGARPVDRVAGSLLSSVESGAQPASRSRIHMFDESASIWRFLDQLGYPQLPWSVLESKDAAGSKALIEVFPALSLLSLVPEFSSGVERLTIIHPIARHLTWTTGYRCAVSLRYMPPSIESV